MSAGSVALNDVSPLFVGLAAVEIHFPGARSLKDKRQDLRPLVERLRSRLGVLVVECGHQDLHQRAALAISTLATEPEPARSMAARALEFVNENCAGMVVSEALDVVQVR